MQSALVRSDLVNKQNEQHFVDKRFSQLPIIIIKVNVNNLPF